MIKLYQFHTALGLPNLSPFCLKVEAFLRLAGLPYEIVWTPNPGKGPLGKLPFIRDGETIVADSSAIVEHLKRAYGVTLDAQLTPPQRALATAFRRLLEEHLYWALIYARWVQDEGFARIAPVFFAPLPAPLRGLVARIARRQTLRAAHGHGLSRHAPEEVWRRAGEDIDALAAQLGDQPFFLGSEPTSIDASVYAFVANCWQVQMDTPLKALVARHPNLTAYCMRMSGRCFAPARG
ncbi:MAG TPA: glutathione S-transferase family protein [Solimonas sp.]|nr:glutathione S-transferase family protein [Solimonas sp.]